VKLVLGLLMFVAASAQASTAFNPVEFFRGRSHGEGELKIIFQSAKHISVDSEGSVDKDGSLVLKQIIHEPGKPARMRYWRMREDRPNRYSGTLTDAAGPVRVDVMPNAIRVRYRAKDHLNFDQMLTRTGPREVHNATRVKRFGITVAHFNEVIRKLD
jgi:hypothetical protein